jgi:Icc protein
MHTGLSDGVDVKKNFLHILDDVRVNTVDLIVLTGDLVFRETYREVYGFLKQQLEAAQIPFRVIPGNHDDIPALCRIFEMAPRASGETYWAEERDGLTLMFLDSSGAAFSPDQLAWFEKLIKKAAGEIIVFMHHPPCLMGVPYMDANWSFTMSGEFLKQVKRSHKQVTVFCGHYHTERYLRLGPLQVFTCPAVIFQSDPTVNENKIESRRYGWRKIDASAGRLSTTVRWIE